MSDALENRQEGENIILGRLKKKKRPKDALSSFRLSYLNFLFLLCRGLGLREGPPPRWSSAPRWAEPTQLSESPQHRKCLNGMLAVRDASTPGWEVGGSV